MLVAGQVEQLVQKEEELAKQAAELTEKDARIAALLEAAAAPSVMGQQEQQATQKMVAVLTPRKVRGQGPSTVLCAWNRECSRGAQGIISPKWSLLKSQKIAVHATQIA